MFEPVTQIFNLLFRRFVTGRVDALGRDVSELAVEGSADLARRIEWMPQTETLSDRLESRRPSNA